MRPVPRIRPRSAGRLLLSLGAAAAMAFGAAAPALADPAPTTGTAYYVSCHGGKAGGTGSQASPWTALWQISSHGAFHPGDQILLRRGTICHGQLAASGSGTASAPIVLGQWGSGASLPVVSGDGTRARTGAVQLVDVSYWTVRDLHVTNTDGNRNTYTARAGLLFESTDAVRQVGLTASGLTVDHVDSDPATRNWGGIVVLTLPHGTGFGGMRLTGNRIVGVGRSGIVTSNLAYPRSSDRGLRIDHNSLRWVRGDSIIVADVDGGRIDDNVSAYGSNLTDCPVRHCGAMGSTSTATAAIWPTMSSLIRIDHNEVYGEHASAGDGDGVDVDLGAHEITVEQNYLHDNGRAGISFCGARDTTVRFNVLQNDAGPSIVFTCGWQKSQQVRNITIANNTIWAKGGAAWVVRSMHPNAGAGIRFVNNLVSCSGSCSYSWPPSHPVFGSNTFSGSHSSSQPRGSGSVNGSIGLRSPGHAGIGLAAVWGYHLKPGDRPAHGVGIGIGLTDFFGHAVSSTKPVRGASSS